MKRNGGSRFAQSPERTEPQSSGCLPLAEVRMQVSTRVEELLGLALFASVSTLLCCALPSLFVVIGLGATVASVVSAAPWLTTLSRHKHWTFTIAGVLIALNFVYVFRFAPWLRASQAACAVD